MKQALLRLQLLDGTVVAGQAGLGSLATRKYQLQGKTNKQVAWKE